MRVNNLFIVIARAMEAQNASRTIGGKGRKEKEEKNGRRGAFVSGDLFPRENKQCAQISTGLNGYLNFQFALVERTAIR
jgi:hypothetical protein